jgi:hypothetical protein
MPRILAKYTTVGGVTYAPGPVDDDIAKQITNESVWADESHEDEKPKPVKKAATKRSGN